MHDVSHWKILDSFFLLADRTRSCLSYLLNYATQNYKLIINTVFELNGQTQVIGVATFTYAYVVTIPSWVNEKKHGVRMRCDVCLYLAIIFMLSL